MNAADRNSWITEVDFDVRVFGRDGEETIPADIEYLFWVGCAGAFEDRAKKTTKAVAELLDTAGVKFMVLGDGETCTGDPARRAGNEFIYQMQAMQNVEMLNEIKATKIVVTCPHCLNTLKREYPKLVATTTLSTTPNYSANWSTTIDSRLLLSLVKASPTTTLVISVVTTKFMNHHVNFSKPQVQRRLKWSDPVTSHSAAALAGPACGWRRRLAPRSTKTAVMKQSLPGQKQSRWPVHSVPSCSTTLLLRASKRASPRVLLYLMLQLCS